MSRTETNPYRPASCPKSRSVPISPGGSPEARVRRRDARRAERAAATRHAALVVVVVIGACGPPEPTDVIDRDVFIATYVDLRTAALDTDTMRLSDQDRSAVLARHGVTADELVRFAQVHGGDLEFMRDVWNDVELALDRTPEPDTANEGPDSARRSDTAPQDDAGPRAGGKRQGGQGSRAG